MDLARRWAISCGATGCQPCSRPKLTGPDSDPVRVRLHGRGPDCFSRHQRRGRPDPEQSVRIAARRCSSAATKRPACAASTTAGSSTRLASASTCPTSRPSRTSSTKVKAVAYPTHESRRHRLGLHGPGREAAAASATSAPTTCCRSRWRASKTLSHCNFVQAMEGDLDTAHISFLHRSLDDGSLNDDGTDRPGYSARTSRHASRLRTARRASKSRTPPTVSATPAFVTTPNGACTDSYDAVCHASDDIRVRHSVRRQLRHVRADRRPQLLANPGARASDRRQLRSRRTCCPMPGPSCWSISRASRARLRRTRKRLPDRPRPAA